LQSPIKKTSVQKGLEIEHWIADYLQQQGLRLLYRNFRCRLGEIDLILQHEEALAFVEVRFRRNANYGGALESINFRKQQKIIHTARYFLLTHPKLANLACRFDVIAVTLKANKPYVEEWIQNAFY
jgi:putative endonuclease